MTREKRLEKAGYKVSYLMGTCADNRGKMKVSIRRGTFQSKTFNSVTAAHKYVFGY